MFPFPLRTQVRQCVTCAGERSPAHADWANLSQGGWHLSYFMTPEEIVAKVRSFSHSDRYNEHPYNTTAWHQEQARRCQVPLFGDDMVYIPRAELVYPRVPWYGLTHFPTRFLAHSREI